MNDEPVVDLVRTVELVDMVAYAGATWDWHRMHYDAGYAAEHGLDAPVVDGQLLGALMVEQVQDHYGPDCFVTAVEFRFTAMVFAGDTITVTGTAGEPQAGLLRVEQRVLVGERLCARGATTVRQNWVGHE